MTPEEWRPVVGFEGFYEVSARGLVRSLDRNSLGRGLRKGRVLSFAKGRYLQVRLCVNGVVTIKSVHHLVAESFIGPRPDGLVACHNDGDRWNNTTANLRYDTLSENNRDTVRHGAHRFAEKTHCVHGHEFTPENTLTRPKGVRGHRSCRICNNEGQRRRRAQKNRSAA